MDKNQYMSMYMDESKEHLQSLNSCLLDLENNPENHKLLDEIFRSAHTIKGMSATMGFTVIAEMTHEMENLLDLLRKNQLIVNHNIIDILFRCVDTLEQLTDRIENPADCPIDIKPLLVQLRTFSETNCNNIIAATTITEKQDIVSSTVTILPCLTYNDTEKALIQLAMGQGVNVFYIKTQLNKDCMLKSARTYMVMKSIEDYGDVIKTIPTIEDLENEKFSYFFEIVLITDESINIIRDVIMGVSEIDNVDIVQYTQNLFENSNFPTANNDNEEQLKTTNSKIKTINTLTEKHKSMQTVRVDIEKLDALLNLVGELVINKTRLEQINSVHKENELTETIEQIDRVTSDLQNVVMKVRMVPVKQVFNRFPRMVRDLSHELHKDIELDIQGEDTELDRTVIDEIGDPLVHLLRNALDHGIESLEERKKKGKSSVGHVSLIAKQEGNSVIIQVKDDGNGIAIEKIRQAALIKGLLTQSEIDKMGDSEILRVIFRPGFSTATSVTDVSGRGVGMDAVKTKIESLGGTIDVETEPDRGSCFTIRLPLTLAIIQALLIKIAEEIYAIPLASINSTINIPHTDIKTIQNQEVILLRGKIIPVLRLSKLLKAKCSVSTQQDDIFIVVVHCGEQTAGIIVDTLLGQQEIVIKSIGKVLSFLRVIAGATILGDGQVALILDVAALMQAKSEV